MKLKRLQARDDASRHCVARGVAAVLLPVSLLGAAVACGQNGDGEVYKDPISGVEHLLATDAKKHTVTNDKGMLVALRTDLQGGIVTDKSGVQATLLLEYPCFVHEKKFGRTVLELADFTVKLPKGWSVSPSSVRSITLERTDEDGISDASISYAPRKENYAELKTLFEARKDAFHKQEWGSSKASIKAETKQWFGKEAYMLVYDIPSSGGETDMVTVNGIVQPGDFCVEVTYMISKTEYNDGKTFDGLVALIEPK